MHGALRIALRRRRRKLHHVIARAVAHRLLHQLRIDAPLLGQQAEFCQFLVRGEQVTLRTLGNQLRRRLIERESGAPRTRAKPRRQFRLAHAAHRYPDPMLRKGLDPRRVHGFLVQFFGQHERDDILRRIGGEFRQLRCALVRLAGRKAQLEQAPVREQR